MIRSGYGHSSDEFRVHNDFLATSENIFMGPRSADEAHVGWMESAGHRENILSPHHVAIGIGVVCRNDGRMWATQVFGVSHSIAPAVDLGAASVEPIVRSDAGPACPAATGPTPLFDPVRP